MSCEPPDVLKITCTVLVKHGNDEWPLHRNGNSKTKTKQKRSSERVRRMFCIGHWVLSASKNCAQALLLEV